MSRKRTVVLISGRGSNMTALIAAASDPAYPAEIVGVISDRVNAAGLGIAAARGIPTKVIVRSDHASKEAHDAAIDAALVAFNAEIVALAGYLRILSRGLVEKWQGRMLNIHPALLPALRAGTRMRAPCAPACASMAARCISSRPRWMTARSSRKPRCR